MKSNVDRLTPAQMATSYTEEANQFYERMESLTLSMLPTVPLPYDITVPEGLTYASLGTEVGTLHFYQMLIKTGGFRTVLELGTFIGVSTMFLADAVGSMGKVMTIESGEQFYSIAEGNIARNGYENITQVFGDCVSSLRYMAQMGRKFDMILMDAAKESYDEMLYPALSCLTDKGLLLIDDAFFQGETLNDTTTSAKGLGVKRCLDKLAGLTGYDKVILPMGNGLVMVRKS